MNKCHRKIYSIQVDFTINKVELTKCCYLHGNKISIEEFKALDNIIISPNELPSSPYHIENCLMNCDFEDNRYEIIDICCSSLCNAKCYHCCAADHSHPDSREKDLLYNFILPKVKGFGYGTLQLDGKGEVFLNYKEITSFLKTLSFEKDFKTVRFLTNGSTLTKERLLELKSISDTTGINYIFAISVDGISKKTFEAVRCGLSFENVMANLQNTIEIFGNNNVDITFTIKEPNKEDTPYVKDFLVNNYNILPERIAMQSDFLDKNMNQYLTNYFKDR